MNREQGSSILNTDVYRIKNTSNHKCGCLYEAQGGGLGGSLLVKWEQERES